MSVTFLFPNKKVTKEVVIGAALEPRCPPEFQKQNHSMAKIGTFFAMLRM